MKYGDMRDLLVGRTFRAPADITTTSGGGVNFGDQAIVVVIPPQGAGDEPFTRISDWKDVLVILADHLKECQNNHSDPDLDHRCSGPFYVRQWVDPNQLQLIEARDEVEEALDSIMKELT
jgi:hypothetical protein